MDALRELTLPDTTDVRLMAGSYVKEMRVAKAQTHLMQHVHKYSHVSVIVRGACRVYQDRVWLGDMVAPASIVIPAHMPHRFVTLEDDTVILCVHDMEAEVV